MSIQGGGGAAGSASTFGYKNVAATVGVSVGGTGGTGGTGGDVIVVSSAAVETKTDDSIGILAQSIGGGGGVGGKSTAGGTGYGKGSLNVSVGGGGGTGNTSGIVDLISSNSIKTSGDNAYGLLDKVLVGGGNSGATINVTKDSGIAYHRKPMKLIFSSVGQGGGTGAESSAVKLQTPPQSQLSKDAIGLFAQSIGGSEVMLEGLYWYI